MRASIIKLLIKQATINVKACIRNDSLSARLVNTYDGCCRAEFYDQRNVIWTTIAHIPIDDLPTEDLEALL
jgi:hypothetical protein